MNAVLLSLISTNLEIVIKCYLQIDSAVPSVCISIICCAFSDSEETEKYNYATGL